MSYNTHNYSYRRNRISEPTQLLTEANLWTPTATQYYMLGCIYELNDGRKYRYCQAGEALTAGYISQSAVGTANWQNEAQTNGSAFAIGDKEVTVVLATTASENQFAEGYLTIEDGTGEGQMYLIAKNKAGTANATSGYDVKLTLADEGGIRVATATTSEVTITLNKYKDVIAFPTDPTGTCTGVSPVAVTDNYFFWSQVKGPAAVVNGSDTIVVGDLVVAGAQAAGVLALPDNGTACEGDVEVGYVMRAASSGETALVDLTIE